MKYKNLSDCHTHSNHSYDGKNSLTEMCERAKELNLLHYCCTDHCECLKYWYEKEPYYNVVANTYNEMESLKEKYPFLLSGIELSHPLQVMEAADDALNGRSFDCIIGAIHTVKTNMGSKYWKDPATDVNAALIKYFEMIIDLIKWGKMDTIAHLSYPLRHVRDANGDFMTFDPYLDYIAEIYRLLMENGIALELNSSGLRKKTGDDFYPNAKLIKMYRDMGGELITIGSDGHCIRSLGSGMVEAMDILTDTGFEYFTVYKNRKPMMVKLE